jgi:hypothetical protein
LCLTALGGERRFAAAVARRLSSLGALTRGDRRAASGLDLAALDLDSPLGRAALRRMYESVAARAPVLPPGAALAALLEGVPEDVAAPLRPRPDAGGRVSATAVVEAAERLHGAMAAALDAIAIALPNAPRAASGGGSGGAGASTSAAAAPPAPSAKDLGDVKRFLNRLLAAPVDAQRLLFSYFTAALAAEARAARAAGALAEGVSDLPGQSIARAAPPAAVWADPATGQVTLSHALSVDRGVPWEAAAARLACERRPGDRSAFYAGRRPAPGSGSTLWLLGLQRPGGAFLVVRPNTGPAGWLMEPDELHAAYQRVEESEAEAPWQAAWAASLTRCSHGLNCRVGAECSVGRRMQPVAILAGGVVRIWDALERCLQRHEFELSRADRALRVVRVELGGGGDGGEALIGVRFPGHLLAEVIDSLRAGAGAAGAPAAAAAAPRLEAPTPIDARALKAAFQAPRDLRSFFSAAAKRPAEGGAGAAPAAKRPRSPLADASPNGAAGAAAGPSAPADPAVARLVDLGFAPADAWRALAAAGGSVELAADALFSAS